MLPSFLIQGIEESRVAGIKRNTGRESGQGIVTRQGALCKAASAGLPLKAVVVVVGVVVVSGGGGGPEAPRAVTVASHRRPYSPCSPSPRGLSGIRKWRTPVLRRARLLPLMLLPVLDIDIDVVGGGVRAWIEPQTIGQGVVVAMYVVNVIGMMVRLDGVC